MATYSVRILKVITNGPYAYQITKDGAGMTSVQGLATFTIAFNAARDDVAADLGGLVPQNATIVLQAT